ncbi:MAG: phage tail protein [Roseobacter sp.]
MDLFTPPVAFHFSVMFVGLIPPVPDMAFQEVSGLEHGLDTEAVVEGGENRFVHQLPKPAKRGNLKLKRGMTTAMSGLVQWCKSTIEGDFSETITTKDIGVSLLNEMRLPVAAWSIENAYPVKWTVGGFDAMKNELAVETIELAYTTLIRRM